MFIVFDIGGTNTRIAASHDGITIEEPVIYPTPKKFDEGIAQFAATAQKLANGAAITAVAGGIAGPMDPAKTKLLTAPNIPDWNGKPLRDSISHELHTPVFLENDTAMWGLGEAIHGAGMGKEIVVYVTVSTGVGGCRIVRDAIDSNAHGFEPGHMVIDPDGPVCGCGGKGHLEAFAGGLAMEKQFGKKAEHIHDDAAWEEKARFLAIGLLNICVLWSPHIIILGGSMMKSISLDRVRFHMQSLNTIFPILPPVTLSRLEEKGGLIGSLAYARGRV